jgi:hypothetical protein
VEPEILARGVETARVCPIPLVHPVSSFSLMYVCVYGEQMRLDCEHARGDQEAEE